MAGEGPVSASTPTVGQQHQPEHSVPLNPAAIQAAATVKANPYTLQGMDTFQIAADKYKGPWLPSNESERCDSLCKLGILDGPGDPRFDDITKLVRCCTACCERLQLLRSLEWVTCLAYPSVASFSGIPSWVGKDQAQATGPLPRLGFMPCLWSSRPSARHEVAHMAYSIQ